MIKFVEARFKNILSFGNMLTTVNFLKAKKTIIIGSNGQGKSALIDVITFALYGKPFRKVTKGGLINSINRRELHVELDFIIRDKKYTVVRGQNPGVFEIYVDGSLLPQDASNRDYQKALENDILKLNYRTFTQIVILGSGSYVQFMKLGTGAKREIIEDILDISVFSRMNELLRSMMKEEQATLEKLDMMKDHSKNNYTLMYEKSKKSEESKAKRIKDKELEYQQTLDDIKKKKKEKENVKLPVEIEDEKPIAAKKDKLVRYEAGINKNLKQTQSEIKFYDEHDTCPKCKKELDPEFKDQRISLLQEKKKEFSDGLDKIKSLMQDINKKIKSIKMTKLENKQINDMKRDIQSQINSLEYRLDFLDRDIKAIQSEKNEVVTAEELEGLKAQVKEADEKLKAQYKVLHTMKLGLSILRDNGAKTSIIKFYLPMINKTINEYLHEFDFNVLFMFDENFDETMKARHIDSYRYGNFSEGERMRIDLALTFTWREIAKRKNSASTNLLFFDEVLDSSMDLAGLDNFMRVIDAFDPDVNLFIISHREGVSAGFDNVITAQKVGNFSEYSFS